MLLLLPPKRDMHYPLRPRAHDFTLSTLLNDHDITRVLFKTLVVGELIINELSTGSR